MQSATQSVAIEYIGSGRLWYRLTIGETFLDGRRDVSLENERELSRRRIDVNRCHVRIDGERQNGSKVLESVQDHPGRSRRGHRIVELEDVGADPDASESVDERLDEGTHSRQKVNVACCLISRALFVVFRPYLPFYTNKKPSRQPRQ